MSAAAAKQAPCTLRATCGGSLFNAASGMGTPAAWAVSMAGCECIERSAVGHTLDEAVLDFVQGLAAVPLPDPPPVLRALLGHTLDEVLLRGITALYSLVGYDLPEHPDEDGEFLVANEANSWLTRRYNILAEEEARLGPDHPSVVRRREVLREMTRALRRGQLPQELTFGSDDADEAAQYTGSDIFAGLESPNTSQVIASEGADVGRDEVQATGNVNGGRAGNNGHRAENHRTDNHQADNRGVENHRAENNRAANNGAETHRAENHTTENHRVNNNGANNHLAENHGADNNDAQTRRTENHRANNNDGEIQRADNHGAENQRRGRKCAEIQQSGTACLPCTCTEDDCGYNHKEQQDWEQELTGFPPRNTEFVAMPAWMLPGVNFEDIDRDYPSEEELVERQRRRSGSRRHSRSRDADDRLALEDLFFRRPPTTVYPAMVPGDGTLPADSPSSESQGDSGADIALAPVCACCMSEVGEQESPCRCSGADEHPEGVCVCSCHWEDPVCGHGSAVCVCVEPSSDYFTGAQITPHTSSHSARAMQAEQAEEGDLVQRESFHEQTQQAERRTSFHATSAKSSAENLKRQPASINLPISQLEVPATDNISEMSKRQRSASAAPSLPSREGAGETVTQPTKSTKTAPCHCPGPGMRPEQILWATTKIYVYADNSRTYEVLTPSFEKPLWVKGRTHVLFAMKSPPKSIGDGAG